MDENRRIKILTEFIFPNNEHYITIDGKYYKTLEEYFE